VIGKARRSDIRIFILRLGKCGNFRSVDMVCA
jgi:hypothetical protein